MIVSENKTAKATTFETVLNRAVRLLKDEAKSDAEKYLASAGVKLEGLVCEAITETAKGTEFDDSIQLVSGHKFPDVILKGGLGVEVKSTTQNHWKTIGNSVLESTRIPNIDRIFLFFGKLAQPIDFRVRPYEDCMADVVVSHYPRYSIDMELSAGQTIFNKISRSYDDVRKLDNPVDPFVGYYKSRLKPGESLWWTGNDARASSAPFTVKFWSNERADRRNAIKVRAMILFPEIFGDSPTKYAGLAMWLLNEHGLISPNLRDNFTAGGQAHLAVGGVRFRNVRKIVKAAVDSRREIVGVLAGLRPEELRERWGRETPTGGDRVGTWLGILWKNRYISSQEHELLQLVFAEPSAEVRTLRKRGRAVLV